MELTPLALSLALVVLFGMLAWGSGFSVWLHNTTAHNCHTHPSNQSLVSIAANDDHGCAHEHKAHAAHEATPHSPLKSSKEPLEDQDANQDTNQDTEDETDKDNCGLCHLLAGAMDHQTHALPTIAMIPGGLISVTAQQTPTIFRATWPEVRGPPSIA